MISDELMERAKSMLVDARLKGPLLIQYLRTDPKRIPRRSQRHVFKGTYWHHDDTLFTLTHPNYILHDYQPSANWYETWQMKISLKDAFKRLESNRHWTLNWGTM